MESTKDLLERSKELKKNIRAGLNKNKSVLTQSRESRAIRQAKLKKIKDEMGLNLLPLAPSIITKSKNMIKKGLSSSEKDELDDLKNKSDLDDDELQRFSELQEKNSNDFEDMDEMRNNLQEMTNQVKQNRIDLRQNDEDINDDPKPQRTEPEESNDGIEDAGNDLASSCGGTGKRQSWPRCNASLRRCPCRCSRPAFRAQRRGCGSGRTRFRRRGPPILPRPPRRRRGTCGCVP